MVAPKKTPPIEMVYGTIALAFFVTLCNIFLDIHPAGDIAIMALLLIACYHVGRVIGGKGE